MNKPITVLREEFVDGLAELINSSALPAFVLSEVMERTLNQLRALEAEQYKRDKAAWEEQEPQTEVEAE